MSFPTLAQIYRVLFDSDMGVTTSPTPSNFAIIQACVVGIIIPVLSAIAPIQQALGKNLNESLDL